MGLAGALGDDGYRCRTCGQCTALYSPNCPQCLKPTLVRIKQDKSPRASQSIQQREPERPKGGSAWVSYALLLGILGVIAAVYQFFIAPLWHKPDASPVAPVVNAGSVHANKETSKHVRHIAHPGVPVARQHTQDAAAPSREPRSMKLWQTTEDY
jgi:hypothetical protein